MRAVAALLAHGGGWDEAAFIALPVALFGGLLAVADKRAQAVEGRQAERDHGRSDANGAADDELG